MQKQKYTRFNSMIFSQLTISTIKQNYNYLFCLSSYYFVCLILIYYYYYYYYYYYTSSCCGNAAL